MRGVRPETGWKEEKRVVPSFPGHPGRAGTPLGVLPSEGRRNPLPGLEVEGLGLLLNLGWWKGGCILGESQGFLLVQWLCGAGEGRQLRRGWPVLILVVFGEELG